MVGFFIKRKGYDENDLHHPKVRELYGIFGSATGIACNALLFLLKLAGGIFSGSIAILSDAFNNLSDMGTSLVSLLGIKISNLSADHDHPYGHGRAEYIASLIVSLLILFVGQELFVSSLRKIFSPVTVELHLFPVLILFLSILFKGWMWYFNQKLGKKISSPVLLAAAKDSLCDCFATGVVLLSLFLSPVVSFPIDGIMGLLVSCLIFWSGYEVARDTIHQLLGHRPSKELEDSLTKTILEEKTILGIHDLMVHDYGPGRIIASVHAEVPKTLSLVECHSMIDTLEHKILEEFHVDIVIHMDPV